MLDKEFMKFLLIEGLCNEELEEDFDKDKNSLDKWIDMWYNEYIEKHIMGLRLLQNLVGIMALANGVSQTENINF